MTRKWRTMIGGSFFAAVAAAFFYYGSLFHLLIAFFGLLGFAFFAFLSVIALFAPDRKPVLLKLCYLSVPFVACIVSFVIGSLYLSLRIDETKRKLERIVVEIEGIRSQTGSYPSSIDSFVQGADLPWFVRDDVRYSPSEKTFSLTFANPGPLLYMYSYNEEKHGWSIDL
jgi:hypothetical protein